MAGLLVLVSALGLLAAVAMDAKSDATVALVEEHEPTAADMQRMYRALSDADATAASAFLAAGSEPDELRKRYEDNIAVAGPTLGLAAVDRGGDPRVATEIGIVGRQVPVYAGLVETARVYGQQGLPVGGAYLREASQLMQAKILPAASNLYRVQADRVIAERDDATRFPFGTVLLALAALGVLIGGQIYLFRMSQRRLNLGLLAATVAIVLGLAWTSVASIAHASTAESGHHAERVTQLSQARITALRARSDELLALIARGTNSEHTEQFGALTQVLVGKGSAGGSLRAARDGADRRVAAQADEATAASNTWLQAYQDVRELDEGGSYDDAVKLAIDEKATGSSAAAFGEFDRAISGAIDIERQLFVDQTLSADRALSSLVVGWILIGIISAFGVVYGVWQRLREFR